MQELLELAKVMEMKGAVGSRKIAEAASNTKDQLRNVLEFREKMPNFVHYVNDYSWTKEPSLVLVMSTVGRNSGVGLLERMRREGDGDLRRAWLFIDVVERKVIGEWKCFGMHVYSFTQRRLHTIAIVYLKSTTQVVYSFAFAQVEKVAAEYGVIMDCYGFSSDAEGAMILAVKERYNPGPERYQECVFHFEQNGGRLVTSTLPGSKR